MGTIVLVSISKIVRVTHTSIAEADIAFALFFRRLFRMYPSTLQPQGPASL